MQNNKLTRLCLSGLSFCLLLLVIGCTAKEIRPPVNIEDEFVNQQIKVRVANYANTFKTTDSVSLELKYDSKNTIVLPIDYNLKIFELIDNQWLEISEKPTERFPADNIVLTPDKVLPAVEMVVLFPDIKDTSKSHKLRIYVIGEMQTQNGNQQVAAFTDIELNP
jgi:hypothetical protein